MDRWGETATKERAVAIECELGFGRGFAGDDDNASGDDTGMTRG